MQVGINASRARSGGAKAHLKGILLEFKPKNYGIVQIHLFAYQELLDNLPNFPWLVKQIFEYDSCRNCFSFFLKYLNIFL